MNCAFKPNGDASFRPNGKGGSVNQVHLKGSELRSILITGATGGIGMELARRYAKPGRTLILWGRNAERLQRLATLCCARGAAVVTRQINLLDGKAALQAIREDDTKHPLDLVILGAGLSDIQTAGHPTEDPEKVLALSLVNFAIPTTLATAAAERMIPRGGGKIALIGSVAGFYELPFAASYSSSKAGLARFAEAANLGWAKHNVRTTLIIPGFVDTPMSQRLEGTLPFLVSAGSAARRIMRAINAGKKEYIFPWQFRALRVAERLVPHFLRERILLNLKADQKPAKNS
ncbi:oxidoreductase [Acetobacter tropicalis]|uniref:Oxidoreductase n=2 Tax=Acetobacter tropicalis TaxID=104102 RepID=A0A252A9W2_9PROT|nr:oxidoreductase [Acetobacter tropicalis]